jgi:hypothetical protein
VRSSNLCSRVVVMAVTAWFVGAADAAAQLSLPQQGEGYVSLVYSSSASDKHYLPTTRYDIGRVDSHALLADITFGLTDRLAVSVGLPVIAARYLGDFPHQIDNPDRLDDGDWHSTWQDFRFGLSYNMMNGPLILTPFVGGVAPSHGYEYFAHSAAGRQLKELQAGVALAAGLNWIHPGVFLQSRYSFGFVEQNVDVRPNHSNLDLEFGYFATASLRVFVLSAGQFSHAGIDVPYPTIARIVLTTEQIQHHDQIDKIHYLKVGGGASFELTDSVTVYGALSTQVAGRNGHQMNRAISVGLTWSFRTKKPTLFGATAAAPVSPAASRPYRRPAGK